MRGVQPVATRRLLLGAAAALSSLPPRAAVGSGGLSRTDLSSKLSRVPIFVITNKDAAPYLTEVDAAGRRSGFFFVSPQEAVQALSEIKAFDQRASLSVVPLDDVYFDISATAAQAAAAPQPTAGTSTDLRLFRLRPLADELANAAQYTGDKLAEGSLPLFFEPSLRLAVDDRRQTPYFFRLGDLRAAFEAQIAAGESGLNDPPMPRVVTLDGLVKSLETGEARADTLLVAASEAAAVVARMNGGAGGLPASSGAAEMPPSSPPPDDFFLSVPFAKGRRGA